MPTPEHLIDMHDRIIERTGGEVGILNRGAIEAAVARARWGPFRHGGGLAERAALLIRGIAQDHPFVDGNKRTAFEAAELCMRRNGFALESETEETVGFMVEVARGRHGLEEIYGWIVRNRRRR